MYYTFWAPVQLRNGVGAPGVDLWFGSFGCQDAGSSSGGLGFAGGGVLIASSEKIGNNVMAPFAVRPFNTDRHYSSIPAPCSSH